ncbi:MAG: adenosylcobalamin-dependent ribonucleoside-diphosphate reductase [Firmicutes bacterium]|nr:adenosylcobalamin-dependent ribonucleoside-diphosphate reductase [Bacillota bacterium]
MDQYTYEGDPVVVKGIKEELELPLLFEEEQSSGDYEREPVLTENALTVLKARYLKRDMNNEPTETPADLFRRVAETVASAESLYGGKKKIAEFAEKFYHMITALDFLPNSPTLMNAGREEGQLSACFVLPVGDSMPEIFESVKMAALIQKSGGGVGYSFSQLRPAGDRVKSTSGVSSGPISFMKVFNEATETVKQGGRRRGANMGVLRVDHPDIMSFVNSKLDTAEFTNFNISVAITDVFMEALKNGENYDVLNPRTGKKAGSLPAKEVWEKIVYNAWASAEPGILFIDSINRDNPTPKLGSIESTNPCGEACLLPFEACNLGSINLSHFVSNKAIDFNRLRETVKLAVRFLDNVIDVNEYVPLIPKIKQKTRSNRKIGLGVMGFADMLISLGVSYRDDLALKVADTVMEFIAREGKKASMDLARERGTFPNWQKSAFFPDTPIRNATITSIAPTGTLSIISGCSPGIEPLFGVSFVRNVLDKAKLLEVHPLFEKIARKEGFFSEDLMEKISGFGTIQDIEEIPQKVRELFVTSYDVPGDKHVLMQAAFQRHTDMSVSKTINLPANATIEDVDHTYRLAYESGVKGLTVYRDGSRAGQVIVVGKKDGEKKEESAPLTDTAPTSINEEEGQLNLLSEDKNDEINDEKVIRTVNLEVGSDNTALVSASDEEYYDVPMEKRWKPAPMNGNGNGTSHEYANIPTMFSNETPCPECGQGTVIVGACSTCQHCGYSKCG